MPSIVQLGIWQWSEVGYQKKNGEQYKRYQEIIKKSGHLALKYGHSQV